MTSRQRVLAALAHREPDRIPIGFSGHWSVGIATIAYPRLRECLGLPATTIRVYDPTWEANRMVEGRRPINGSLKDAIG